MVALRPQSCDFLSSVFWLCFTPKTCSKTSANLFACPTTCARATAVSPKSFIFLSSAKSWCGSQANFSKHLIFFIPLTCPRTPPLICLLIWQQPCAQWPLQKKQKSQKDHYYLPGLYIGEYLYVLSFCMLCFFVKSSSRIIIVVFLHGIEPFLFSLYAILFKNSVQFYCPNIWTNDESIRNCNFCRCTF